jgi:hypothetical protein
LSHQISLFIQTQLLQILSNVGSEEKKRQRDRCYKTFYARNLRVFVISKSVCPWQPNKPSLMFADKARAYPSEVPFCSSSLVGSLPYPPRLDQAGKGLSGSNTLSYYENSKMKDKKVFYISPRGQCYKTFSCPQAYPA